MEDVYHHQYMTGSFFLADHYYSTKHLVYPCSTVDAAGVKQAISEGLALVRGCRPLRLSLGQLTGLAKHFQQRVS